MTISKVLVLVMVGIISMATIPLGVSAFKDAQDGARILSRNDELNRISDSSYSIPLRKGKGGDVAAAVAGGRGSYGSERKRLDEGGVPFGYDNDEFSLLSRMKTMELPPAVDAINFYAEKYAVAPSGSRFALSRRVRRSPAGGLKFDGDKSGGNNNAMSQGSGTGSRSVPSSPSVNFDGQGKGPAGAVNGKEPTEENKRLFPELFGLGGPGYYGGGYPGGHHGYYPPYGGLGHGGLGHGGLGHGGLGHGGYYPGGGLGHGGYYPGGGLGGGYYPGNVGGASSAAASASASSGGAGLGGLGGGYPLGGGLGLHHNRPYGNGLYGGGYPGGGYGAGYYPGGPVTPILGFGGFVRGENGEKTADGKDVGGKQVSGSVVVGSSGGGKGPGSVNFE